MDAARRGAPGDGYVLFLGTLEPRKNVGALLDAYERARGRGRGGFRQLVLAGQGDRRSRGRGSNGSPGRRSRRVRHIGYVDPTQRRALYEGARLLVQPSFEEGSACRCSKR